MIYAVVIFVVGSSIQAGAVNIAMLFLGRSCSIRAKNFGADSGQAGRLLGSLLAC
jgi:hypothetical protein